MTSLTERICLLCKDNPPDIAGDFYGPNMVCHDCFDNNRAGALRILGIRDMGEKMRLEGTVKGRSKITQDSKFDKSFGGFIPKEKGEVDLVGKLFIRKKGTYKGVGTGTLVCGLLFGLEWNGQDRDEMWECEVNIKPTGKFQDTDVKGETFKGLRIDQVMASEWGDPENYNKVED